MRNFFAFALLSFVLLSSCKKERDKTTWKTEFLTPLVKTELTIADLLKSDALTAEADSSLKLVFNDTLFDLSVDSLLSIQDTVLEFGVSLKTLDLPNDTLRDTISMGDLLRAQGIPQATIDFMQGFPLPIAAIGPISTAPIEIKNEDVFQSIIIDKGTVEIIIDNGLPIDITNLDFLLTNTVANGGSTIINENFPIIASGTQESRTSSLDGKTVYSTLLATLNSISSPGSASPIAIDTNDALIAQIIVRDIVPIEATAVWPDQNLVDTTQLTSFPSTEKAMLNMMKVRKGDVEVKVFSSLKDTIYIDFEVPNLMKNGTTFKISTAVPPAPTNGFADVTLSFPFDGYDFFFNGYGIESTTGVDYNKNSIVDVDTINSYIQLLKGRLPYTGKMVTLSVTDTIFLRAGISNVIPEYAEGYMGKDTITIGPDSINLDIFNNYVSGELDLQQVSMDLSIVNGVGAGSKATISNLSSKNFKNSKSVKLSNTEIDNPISITTATDAGPGYNLPVTASTKTISLNEGNSNIDNFIELLPQQFNYSLEVEINDNISSPPSINTVINNPPNFVYFNNGINASLNLEMPLSMIADTLLLVDTLDFNLSSKSKNNTSGEFTLRVNNGYPFDAITTLYFIDEDGTKIDSLWVSKGLTKGNIDPISKKVTSPNQSDVKFQIDQARLDLLKTSTKVVVLIGFHTFDMSDASKEFYTLYSDYKFDVKLIGDFEYNIAR